MLSRFKNFLKNVLSVMNRPEMMVLPGQLAFFFILSVVPIFTLISYGAHFLHLSTNFFSDFVSVAFTSDVANLLIPSNGHASVSFSFFITIFVGFYIASNGSSSIIIASNEIYDIPDSGYLKRRIKALIMTLILVILFIFILLFQVFGNNIIEIIRTINMDENISRTIILIFNLLKGPITWFIIFFFIKIIYTMAPDRRIPSSYVNYGALFTTVMWIIVTALYSYYAHTFANYSIFYGSLANIVVLMVWVYILATVFVIGMALNYKEEIVKLEKTGSINFISE